MVDDAPPVTTTQPAAHTLSPSGKAITSLVLGILSILGCLGYGFPSVVLGPAAIIFGQLAKNDIANGLVSPDSRGLAKAGVICGIIGCVGAVLGILVFILVVVLAIGAGAVGAAGAAGGTP